MSRKSFFDRELPLRPFSDDLKVRFGGASTTAERKEVQQLPVINALTSTPRNRDVRVHDKCVTTFNHGVGCVHNWVYLLLQAGRDRDGVMRE